MGVKKRTKRLDYVYIVKGIMEKWWWGKKRIDELVKGTEQGCELLDGHMFLSGEWLSWLKATQWFDFLRHIFLILT